MTKVTIEQIKEAYLAKEAKKCANLLYDYIEQNPDIKRQIVEKMVSNHIDRINRLVDYRDVDLGDTITFTITKEDNT